jgi:hypothetical protein
VEVEVVVVANILQGNQTIILPEQLVPLTVLTDKAKAVATVLVVEVVVVGN